MLKGSKVYITEDLSRCEDDDLNFAMNVTDTHLIRSTRDTRRELERFMREVKKNNPGAAVRLDYDRVEVGDKTYVFSHEEGRVVERQRGQGLGSQVR